MKKYYYYAKAYTDDDVLAYWIKKNKENFIVEWNTDGNDYKWCIKTLVYSHFKIGKKLGTFLTRIIFCGVNFQYQHK